MTRRDHRDYLNDMIANAQAAVEIAASGDEAAVLGDKVRRLALERALEILGEAAGKLPAALRDRHPEIPWPQITALRHRLAHGYFGIDHARLYVIARELLPGTLAQIRAVARHEGATRPPEP